MGFNNYFATDEGRSDLATALLDAWQINLPRGTSAESLIELFYKKTPNYYTAAGTDKKPDLKGHFIIKTQGASGIEPVTKFEACRVQLK